MVNLFFVLHENNRNFVNFCNIINYSCTWLPKTPTLHADDTWSVPNQTAASLAGSDNTKTWK